MLDSSSFVSEFATVRGDVVVGPNCVVHPFAVLDGTYGRVTLEDSVIIGERAEVTGGLTGPTAEDSVEREGSATIGARSIIEPWAVVVGASVRLRELHATTVRQLRVQEHNLWVPSYRM